MNSLGDLHGFPMDCFRQKWNTKNHEALLTGGLHRTKEIIAARLTPAAIFYCYIRENDPVWRQ